MKFITDRTLGKLAKWLRILGYDTVYYRGAIDRSMLEKGRRERRIVLTRRRDMAERQFAGRMKIVMADGVTAQLREVIDELELAPSRDDLFTRCLSCNTCLHPADRQLVKGSVPPYVLQTQTDFRICSLCRRIYWPGTHRDNMLRFLTEHNLIRHP